MPADLVPPTQPLPRAVAPAPAVPVVPVVPVAPVAPVPPAPPAGTRGPRPAVARAARTPRTGPQVVAGVVAVVAAALVWAVWRAFVTTVPGQHAEDAAFFGATTGQGRLWDLAEPVLDVVSVTFVVGGLGAAMLVALLRRRWGLAVQVAFLVAGANLTTQVLKYQVLDRPDLGDGWDGANTLPSGHTTVAASVAVAMLLVVPRGWRALVAVLGAAYTAATGVSTLVGQWHRPSDVVAAVLVVLAWGALVCVVTPASSLDVPAGPGARMSTPGSTVTALLLGTGAVVAGVAAVLALGRVAADAAAGGSSAHQVTAYAGGVAGVVAVTGLAFAVLLLLRQAAARPRGA